MLSEEMIFYIGMLLAGMAGGFVQTMVGFGAAVCILLYLTNFMSISEAPSVAAVICFFINLSMTLQFRKAIRLKPILWPLIIYSAVSLIVITQIRSFQVTVLTVAFGVFLILIAVYYLFLAKRIHIKDNGTGMMLASSSLSGLFAGLFSIGGPTLSIYYLALCGTGDFYIASLQLSFLLANVVLLAGRAANGLLTVSMIPAILFGLVGSTAGQIIGKKLRGKLSADLMAKLVYSAVGLSGIMVIAQQLF